MGWPMTQFLPTHDPSPSDENPRSGQERRTPWFPQIVRVCGSCRCGWSCWSYARNMQFWWAVMGQNCQLWMYNYQLLYIQIIRHTIKIKLRPWSYKRGQWGEILHFEPGHSPLTSSFRDDRTCFFRNLSVLWPAEGFHVSDTTNPHHEAEWCEGEWMSDVIKPCKPNAIAIPMP